MDGIALSLGLVLLFVLIGGFFSASELAIVSLRDSQVSRMAATSSRGRRVAKLLGDSNRFLASVQIGVTLAGFFSAAYGGSTLAEPLGRVLQRWGLPPGVAPTVALVAVTAFISYLSLVLGELAPKRLALQRSEGVSRFAAPVLDRVATLTRPVVWLLSKSTDLVVRMLGLDPKAGGEEVTEEELRDMVVTHTELGVEERRLLGDVFEAADRQLTEVMIPRTEVEFLEATATLTDAARAVLDKPHSRYPVIGDGADDVVGFVHVRDLFNDVVGGGGAPAPRTLRDIARPVAMLPGSKVVLTALSELRGAGQHLAVVVDEYGGTDGIVTLEDLIEELVGEISDEYDATVPSTGSTRDDVVVLDGLLHRDEVRERTGLELPEGRYQTLAGFVQTELGKVPAAGDAVDALGHRFTVTEMDVRRVASVRVEPLPDGAGDGDGARTQDGDGARGPDGDGARGPDGNGTGGAGGAHAADVTGGAGTGGRGGATRATVDASAADRR